MAQTDAQLKVLTYPHDHLRVQATPVEQGWDKALELAHAMLATMRSHEGIGLAATQVGDARRIIIADVTAGEQPPLLLANPELLDSSSDSNTHEEGCLSLPGVTALVKRPATVTVRAHDLTNGVQIEIAADELLATCLQHEIDHLNGVLFIDHLSRLRRNHLLARYHKARQSPSDED